MQVLKRIVKCFLLLIGTIFYRSKNSKILYYHDIHDKVRHTDMGTPLELFKRHVRQIEESGYEIVPEVTDSKGQVVIMLDDGFRGIYDTRQFFYDNNIKPTVFLAVSLIDKPGYLTKDEIIELQEHGFNFQSHGWRHENLTALSDEELKLELNGARNELQNILGKKVEQICLPIGYFSEHLLSLLSIAKYDEIYSSIPGDYCDMISGMRRRNLVQGSTPFEVRMILNGGNRMLISRYLKLHKVL